jgi:hypothetical protein
LTILYINNFAKLFSSRSSLSILYGSINISAFFRNICLKLGIVEKIQYLDFFEPLFFEPLFCSIVDPQFPIYIICIYIFNIIF